MRSFFSVRSRAIALPLLFAGSLGASGCAGRISTQQEVQMGRQYASEIERQLPIVQDQAVNSYINQLGRSIAQRVDPRGIPYTFRVVNASEVNAFAVPGGFIYINRGLIERSANMSELAGVLAHEIAHVVERHSVERLERAQGANTLAAVAYGVLLGRPPSTAERVGIQVGGSAVFAHYSRDAEREADQRAVPYLVQSGIHPQGLVGMFERLLAERRRSPSTVERWFTTHPLTEERVQMTQQAIAAIPVSSLRGLATNTRAFEQFKARVRQLPGARR